MSYLLLNRHQWTRQPLLNHTVHQADVPGPHLSYASPVFDTLLEKLNFKSCSYHADITIIINYVTQIIKLNSIKKHTHLKSRCK